MQVHSYAGGAAAGGRHTAAGRAARVHCEAQRVIHAAAVARGAPGAAVFVRLGEVSKMYTHTLAHTHTHTHTHTHAGTRGHARATDGCSKGSVCVALDVLD